MTETRLRVGCAEVDITPPVGTRMLGGFGVRISTGTADPLLAKALVVTDGCKQLALVGVDLALFPRELADRAIAEASRLTGMPAGAIMISATHTHTGPDTSGVFFPDALDNDYMSRLPGIIAGCIQAAQGRLRSATMHIGRSLVYHGLHNRRVVCKDGKALNTWMQDALNDLDRCPQILGAAGPIDPELWVVRFDDAVGKPFCALVNLSLHANSHGGEAWSADYPAVIAEHMRAEYGPEMVSVYMPGACGDVNPTMGGPHWRALADYLATEAVQAARSARPVQGPVGVDAEHVDLMVPRIDPKAQPEEAVTRLNWGGGRTFADTFATVSKRVAAMPEEYAAPITVARLGPLAIAGSPGEAFVEDGLRIKGMSPFRHTIVAELNNDDVGYEPTRKAFGQQGYEPLVGAARVSMEGIEQVVAETMRLLQTLWERSDA
ncbi:MAG: hypothetical protein ACYC4R_04370 [Anaerolineae bacterium]